MAQTLIKTGKRKYLDSHPWLTFAVDFRSVVPHQLWVMLGECQSKCEHFGGVPLKPGVAEALHKLYLARGVQATAAIEGNSLTLEDVEKQIDGQLSVPESREYLKTEITNLLDACNGIANNILSDGQPTITAGLLHDYNKMVMRNIDPGDGEIAGEVSNTLVGVGGYAGAPREDCDYLLERLASWLNADYGFEQNGVGRIAEGIVKAILAHIYLVWIHPWRDGNGRTARLIEFHLLMSHGVPTPACHLLSNFYNQTRTEYYKQLRAASKSGGNVIPFIYYAVTGLRDGLRETINYIRGTQMKIAWENYVHERFRGKHTSAAVRQRHLVFDLTAANRPVLPNEIEELSPRMAKAYADKTNKTITRDLNALLEMDLVLKTNQGKYLAFYRQMEAFAPQRAHFDDDERLF